MFRPIGVFYLAIYMIIALKPAMADLKIIEIRHQISLTDNEPPLKDFYIQTMNQYNLKKGGLLQVFRKIPAKKAQSVENLGFIQVPIGELKIIFIDGPLVIGRLHKIYPREDLPILDTLAIMIGDDVKIADAKAK